MKIISSLKEMKIFSYSARKNGKSIGFVPTMGALHQGHLMLARQAAAENDLMVCSIFVNPIQFNNPLDLKKYPRDLEADSRMLLSIGCDVIFYPSVEEMYPQPETKVYDFGMLDKVMEGKFREGHFNGVAIVVKKLFDIIEPHKAYFGEKDFQQLAIIKSLVNQEGLPVEIISCPIIREADGLAMSSRNKRLTHTQRRQAPHIFTTLKEVAQIIKHRRVEEVKAWVQKSINSNPEMELEYFEIADPQTLLPITGTLDQQSAVACIAVYMGPIRLIDNIIINE